MGVVGACNVLHVHHVHRKPVQGIFGLEHTTVANVTALAFTQPPLTRTLNTRLPQALVGGTGGAVCVVEPTRQSGIQGFASELGGQISQGLVKCSFVGHGQWVQLESGPNLHRF